MEFLLFIIWYCLNPERLEKQKFLSLDFYHPQFSLIQLVPQNRVILEMNVQVIGEVGKIAEFLRSVFKESPGKIGN